MVRRLVGGTGADEACPGATWYNAQKKIKNWFVAEEMLGVGMPSGKR